MIRLFSKTACMRNKGLLFRYVALATVLLILSLSFGEFLHNHEADFQEHSGCPAHVLFFLLSSGLLVFFSFLFILRVLASVAGGVSLSFGQIFRPTQTGRAPPR